MPVRESRLGVVVEGLVGAVLIALAVLTPFLRRRRTRWGATDEEVKRRLPGDDVVTSPRWRWTHAVTIEAPPAEVWPWLAQIGQGKAGFYSYELLENLIGCHIHNADCIVPELQRLEVGDVVRLYPDMGLPVAAVEPGHALVLGTRVDTRTARPESADDMPDGYLNLSWAWLLEEHNGGTRLLTRWQADYSASLANRLGFGPLLLEPISFVMDRKMLLGIKRRAEAAAERSLSGGSRCADSTAR